MSTHFKTYELIGLKEDVSDVISMITPTDTPFLSSIKTDKVHNTLYQWQEDSLRAVQVNKQVEGFTASDETLTPTVMRSNYTQILAKVFRVSGTSDVVAAYGRGKESAREMAKAGKEVKRDLEHAMVGTAQTAVVGDASTAREMASAQAQIHADVTSSNGAVPRALTSTLIETIHEALYDEGSDATILMIKPSDATIVAGFATATGWERSGQANTTTVTNRVDVFMTPFGPLKVVMNRYIKSTDCILYDPANWKTAVLRNWFREVLAKDGDSLRQMIVGEFGLKHSNQKASGLITDLS